MTEFHLYLYGRQRGRIPSSFEESEARLRKLPQLLFEPDGSFVWTRESGEQRVDGMIYDAGGQIQYCELRGRCSLEMWRELCRAISGDDEPKFELQLLPSRELQNLQDFERRWLQK